MSVGVLHGMYTNVNIHSFPLPPGNFFSLYFPPFKLGKVDYFLSSICLSLVHNLIDGLLCNL